MKRLLIIEDDKGDFDSLAGMLEPITQDVRWTQLAHEALRTASEEPFDLTFLDVNVSDMNPWVALRFLNSMHPFLPVIVLAEKVSDHARAAARGADACFSKPIDADELRATVRALLEERRPMRKGRRMHARTPARRLPVQFNTNDAEFDARTSKQK